jgi:hypothetical protein
MSRSLIRKNQLHPDIADLISGYGDNFFITPIELTQSLINLQAGLPIEGIVYTTGNQTINGIKNFTIRPTVNGIGVLLQGEAINNIVVENVVYTTGNQTISGTKNFISRPSLNGIGLATTGEIGETSTVFDGNRRITLEVAGFTNLEPGGDNLVTFLDNLFYPFVQAKINLNSFNTVYELGTTLNSINFQGTITTGSLNISQITNLEAFVDNTPRVPVLTSPSANFTNNVTVNLTNTSNNVFLRASSRDKNNQAVTIQSNTRSINFAAPWYYGSGAANLSPAQIQSLFVGPLRKVELPSNKTITITANNQKIYFAYPQSWGVLTSIKDENTFENIDGWLNRPNLNFTLANGSTHVYTIRETILFNTFINPFRYTFIF